MISRGITASVAATMTGEAFVIVSLPLVTERARSINNIWLRTYNRTRDRAILAKTQKIMGIHTFRCQSVPDRPGPCPIPGVCILDTKNPVRS